VVKDQLKDILFIDIETVPISQRFNSLSERMQAEWTKKSKHLKSNANENADAASLFEEKGGIFSEFSKVVCIGIGSLHQHEDGWKMRLKSLISHNEKDLLKEFCEVLTKFNEYYSQFRFCGHNIKEFDIPFLCRRMVINGLGLPDCMQLSGKKPWEISHLDTLELWRFGDYKHFTSLSLLAAVLDIPSPKEDIDGSMVSSVYYKENDLERIGKYCRLDVLTAARVFLKLKGLGEIDPEPIFT